MEQHIVTEVPFAAGGLLGKKSIMEQLKPSGNLLLYDGSHRRLVVYIGPAKTGSTTLQTFLAKYANRDSAIAATAMEAWNYLLLQSLLRNLHKKIEKPAILKEVRKEFQGQSSALNLVVASEFLYTNPDQFKHFSEWSNVTTPEIVIHSRTPRFSHLKSLWKQHSQKGKGRPWYGWPFRRFVCSKKTNHFLPDMLSTTFDPIGTARNILHKLKLPVYMMDMAGVEEQGMDISHAFACTILQVNCTDGNKWVDGIPMKSIQENVRSGEAEVTEEQIDRINSVFRQRDCAYGDDVYKHPLFRLFYETSETWPNHCRNVQAMPTYRRKPRLMLEEIRRIMECPRYDDVGGQKHTTSATSSVIPSSQGATTEDYFLNLDLQQNNSGYTGNNDFLSKVATKDSSANVEIQLPMEIFLYLILAIIVGLFVSRKKPTNFPG